MFDKPLSAGGEPQPADLVVSASKAVLSAESPVQNDCAVAVIGNSISAIGTTQEILERFVPRRRLEAPGCVLLPGLINTHTHLFQNYLKGLGEGRKNADWIRTVTIPSLLNMRPRDMYLAALTGCLDAIRSGTTFLVEYMYPNPRHEMGDAVLKAMSDSGIRGLLGRGVAEKADRESYPTWGYAPELVEPMGKALDDVRRLANEAPRVSDGRISVCLSPPNIRCYTEDGLQTLMAFADDQEMMITVHLCETGLDEEVTQKRYGMRPVEWLRETGFLRSRLLLVHFIQINSDEIMDVAASGAAVSHNPVSNMYLGNGIAPVIELMNQNVPIGLATDGAASNNTQDMLEVLKATVLLQRIKYRDADVMYGRDAFRLASIGGARALGQDKTVGSIEVGKAADFVLVDFSNVKSTPTHNVIATLCFSTDPRAVRWVVIGGEIVLDDGQVKKVDEDAILAETQEAAERVVGRRE